jgi:heme exporter protein A
MSATLELVDLACQRGRRVLFRNLGVSLVAGQLLRVDGANGAGKTTLLRMLCGVLPPAAGEVRWQGKNIARLRDEFSAELLYLGHAPALKDELSALENLTFATVLAGRSASTDQLVEALERAGLSEKKGLPVRFLSQGQRRRAALARLEIAQQQPLWVLDEPFNALDKGAIMWLTALIERHLADGGNVVLTSHQVLPISTAVQPIELAL